MTAPEIDTIIERYGGKESAILAILQDIQAKEKYLPREALEHVGTQLEYSPQSRSTGLRPFTEPLA